MVCRNFIPHEQCLKHKKRMDDLHEKGHYGYDSCKGSICFQYEHHDLLEECTDYISMVTEKNLEPTYDYSRIYYKGNVLRKHKDRAACEYSVTINIDTKGEPWAIYMGGKPVILEQGDAVIYKGRDIQHWRDECPAESVHQIFLHYVDMDGDCADEAHEYLKRKYANE